MNLKVAMSGSSGAGKTTLVEWVALEMGLTHLSGSAGDLKTIEQKYQLFEELGYPGGGHQAVIRYSALNPEYGRLNQEMLVQSRASLIADNSNFVTDRSPVDNATYASIQCCFNLDTEAWFRESILAPAMEAYGKLTHVIFVRAVQPENLGVERNDSRVDNQFYQKAVVDPSFKYYFDNYFRKAHPHVKFLELDMWDLQTRRDLVLDFLS